MDRPRQRRHGFTADNTPGSKAGTGRSEIHGRDRDWIVRLARPSRIDQVPPVSARFVFALRVIARHDRAAQDPFPFLAVRLGSLTVASLAIEFAQLCSRCWPEPIRVGAPCCQMLGYDETTLARMVAAASLCDRDEFSAEIDGLVRYDRHERLWQAAVRLAGADTA